MELYLYQNHGNSDSGDTLQNTFMFYMWSMIRSDSFSIFWHMKFVCNLSMQHNVIIMPIKNISFFSVRFSYFIQGTYFVICKKISIFRWIWIISTVCYYVTYEFQSESALYSLAECQVTPCSKQATYLKFKWQ